MRFTDFKLPASLDEARAALKELGDSGFPIAGGTSLVFRGGADLRVAVDLSRLGLEGVSEVPGGFKIGSGTRIADIQEFHAEGWILDRVARLFSTQQIRNVSTIGGNVARTFRWSDFPVALLVLDCEFGIQGDSERVLPVSDYFAKQPRGHYGKGELLTWLKVENLPKGAGFGYRKELRTHADFSLATAAAVVELDGAKIRSLRTSLGGAVPIAARLPELEGRLAGRTVRKKALREDAFLKEVSESCEGLRWKGHTGMSDEYMGALAVATIRDAVADACLEALGEEAGHG